MILKKNEKLVTHFVVLFCFSAISEEGHTVTASGGISSGLGLGFLVLHVICVRFNILWHSFSLMDVLGHCLLGFCCS